MKWTSIGSYKLRSGVRDGWSFSHAQLPTVLCLDDSSVRVFFATRSEEQVSSIGFVDLFFDTSDSFEIVNISKNPVLAPGEAPNSADNVPSDEFTISVPNFKEAPPSVFLIIWTL